MLRAQLRVSLPLLSSLGPPGPYSPGMAVVVTEPCALLSCRDAAGTPISMMSSSLLHCYLLFPKASQNFSDREAYFTAVRLFSKGNALRNLTSPQCSLWLGPRGGTAGSRRTPMGITMQGPWAPAGSRAGSLGAGRERLRSPQQQPSTTCCSAKESLAQGCG